MSLNSKLKLVLDTRFSATRKVMASFPPLIIRSFFHLSFARVLAAGGVSVVCVCEGIHR